MVACAADTEEDRDARQTSSNGVENEDIGEIVEDVGIDVVGDLTGGVNGEVPSYVCLRAGVTKYTEVEVSYVKEGYSFPCRG